MEQKAGVHGRAVLGSGASLKKRIAVNFAIKGGRPGISSALHLQKSALGIHPAQGQEAHKKRKHRRGIVHGFTLDVHGVVKHGGNCPPRLAQNFFADHHQGSPSWAQVFLGPGIDQVKLAKGELAAENIRRHVADH